MFQRFCLLLLAVAGLGAAFASVSHAQTTPRPGDTPTPGYTPRSVVTPTPYRELTPAEREQAQLQTDQGARACAAGCGTIIFGIIVLIVLNVALLIWVARDSRARGMDSSILWMFLVMFTSFLGLVIYLFSRPQGSLVQCHHCGSKRLAVSAICPNCRNP